MNQIKTALAPAFLLAGSLTCPMATAQFGEIRTLTGVRSRGAIESLASDLDGDGVVDILTASADGGEIALYRGLGGGAFAGAYLLDSSVPGLTGVEALDIDGDGDMDPIRVSSVSGRVMVYESLGAGRFLAARPVANAAPGASDMTCLDLDGDLDEDLVVVNTLTGTISWFENLGTGTFAQVPATIGSFAAAESVRAEDYDGDGDEDLFVNSGVALAAFENLGLGGGWAPLAVAGDQYDSVSSMRMGDADGDGTVDVIVVGTFGSTRQISWYRQVNGVFGPRQQLASTNFGQDAQLHDVNGDGTQELIVAVETAAQGLGAVVALENLGGGSFGFATTASYAATAHSIVITDFNGDGIDDILCTSAIKSTPVGYLLNNGMGDWLPYVLLSSSAAIAPQDALLADLDGDGVRDLVVAAYRPGGSSGAPNLGSLAWYPGLGDARFGVPNRINSNGFRTLNVVAEDLDSDGDLDLVTSGDPLAIRENLGAGQFGPQLSLDTSSQWVRSVRTGDIDGDGLPDVVASADGSGVVWFRNQGAVAFGAAQQLPGTGTSGPGPVLGIDVEDLDGDGDEDVLYIEAAPSRAKWSENLGGGMFGLPVTLVGAAELFQEPKTITARDMDSDGVMDIVAGGWRSTFFVRGLGGGAFASAEQVAVLPAWNQKSFGVGDVDGDGALDIVVKAFLPSGSSFPIRWSRNIGGGQFANTQPVALDAEQPEFVVMDDLDGDGDDDVLFGARVGDAIQWVESLALGSPFIDRIGVNYCGPAVMNSTGSSAAIAAEGSDGAADNDVSLLASFLPAQSFGLFVASRVQGFVPLLAGGNGNLCIGSPLARLNASIQSSGSTGTFFHTINVQAIPLNPVVAAQPGETWYFQGWFRDNSPTATSNLTDGLALTFK